MAKGKDPAAVALGRKGGLVTGVAKGTAALSPEERKARAQEAAAARWKNKKSQKTRG